MPPSSACCGKLPNTRCPWTCCAPSFRRLSYYDPEEKVNDHEANVRKAIRLTAQIAYVVAAYDRIRKGKPLIEPDRSLSHAGNFLYMLNGDIPERDGGAGLRYRAYPARRS